MEADQILNVTEATWTRLREAYESGEHRLLFTTSWVNGHAFLGARDGISGRLPMRVEWKGPDRQVEQDPIPADLRIDNVFLVSVKSRSAVLWNRSPSQVFSRTPMALHWYEHTAADEYQALYTAARTLSGMTRPPDRASELTRSGGVELGRQMRSREWPEPLRAHCLVMADKCSFREHELVECGTDDSGATRTDGLVAPSPRPSPIFSSRRFGTGPLRIRVDTPWDWRQSWRFRGLEIRAAKGAGQPQVEWSIHLEDRHTGEPRTADGYVDIRWSHGRFSGHPEAKVQLRTAHESVPGYTALI